MIAPARVAAYDILCAISAGKADLPAAIAFTRGCLHDERDRALAAEIASGVQRQRAALDYLIVQFSRRTIDRLGGRIVLVCGSIVGAVGLTIIGLAPGPLVYAVGCLVLGLAVAMSLYDAAFPALVQVAGPHSNRAITLLTLFGGLASTFFWPIAAAIAARWGWRATYLSFAAINIAVCLPIHLIALPRRLCGVRPTRTPLPSLGHARRSPFRRKRAAPPSSASG